MSLATNIKIVVSGTVDLFYPNKCQLCTEELVVGERYVCLACSYDLPYIETNSGGDKELNKLFEGRAEIQNVYSLLEYSKTNQVQNLLHEIKYSGKTKMATHFGSLLGQRINDSSIDVIVPVPLHKKKLRLRGYNQSTAIANGIQQELQIPVDEKLLKRKTHNLSQTKFSKYDRWENVRSIFSLSKPSAVNGLHILVVDDVLTTGATIEACATEFLSRANCKISVATLAARL